MKMTSHLHLVQRLRTSGVIPLLPVRAFAEWTGKTLPLMQDNQNVCWRLITRMQDKIAIVVQRQ